MCLPDTQHAMQYQLLGRDWNGYTPIIPPANPIRNRLITSSPLTSSRTPARQSHPLSCCSCCLPGRGTNTPELPADPNPDPDPDTDRVRAVSSMSLPIREKLDGAVVLVETDFLRRVRGDGGWTEIDWDGEEWW